jgi:hypothetical protein
LLDSLSLDHNYLPEVRSLNWIYWKFVPTQIYILCPVKHIKFNTL